MAISHLSLTQPNNRASIINIDYVSASMSQNETLTHFGKAMLDALDRVGFGGMVFDARGYLILLNAAARNLLKRTLSGSVAPSEVDWLQHAARRLLDRGTPWLPRDTDGWVTLPGDTNRPLALHRIPLVQSDGQSDYVVTILADLGAAPQPNPATLRRIFGLTAAESKLAIQIVNGETPVDIARDHRVSVATVRSQLASIFGKTQTRRQSELAMLLTRVAILP